MGMRLEVSGSGLAPRLTVATLGGAGTWSAPHTHARRQTSDDPLLELQPRCAHCTFDLTCAPPLAIGMTWSRLPLLRSGQTNERSISSVHIWHSHPSRSNISTELNDSAWAPCTTDRRVNP